MARAIKQGQSIYIPFVKGESVFDSQNRPRMYKSVEQFQKSYPSFRLENPELVEYAPVVHGRWEWDTSGLYPKPLCNRCGEEPWRKSNHQSDLPNYCPNCGARMDGTEENG